MIVVLPVFSNQVWEGIELPDRTSKINEKYVCKTQTDAFSLLISNHFMHVLNMVTNVNELTLAQSYSDLHVKKIIYIYKLYINECINQCCIS